ncbi:hypothetical protein M8C21_006867 [Ambrosia artemisiifolia]|uniref:Uncharacterized protein n=1 Tax=Ambrosia artemisiifolia TaxID=4212 RepID=A0AAD5CFI4_AMBAR|nr:hypothetical protein M8C21_006867 [Ambrosia artemisiifolia]
MNAFEKILISMTSFCLQMRSRFAYNIKKWSIGMIYSEKCMNGSI